MGYVVVVLDLPLRAEIYMYGTSTPHSCVLQLAESSMWTFSMSCERVYRICDISEPRETGSAPCQLRGRGKRICIKDEPPALHTLL